jgi:hypothetical protein
MMMLTNAAERRRGNHHDGTLLVRWIDTPETSGRSDRF